METPSNRILLEEDDGFVASPQFTSVNNPIPSGDQMAERPASAGEHVRRSSVSSMPHGRDRIAHRPSSLHSRVPSEHSGVLEYPTSLPDLSS